METTMLASAGSSALRTCRLCGQQFVRPPRAPRQEFCPDECARRATRLRALKPGRQCEQPGCNRQSAYGRRICDSHRNAARFGKPCVRCGLVTQRDGDTCRKCLSVLATIGKRCAVTYSDCRCGAVYVNRGRRHCTRDWHVSRNGKLYDYIPVVERWVACIKCQRPVWARINAVQCAACEQIAKRDYKREAKHARRARMRAVERVGIRYLIERDRGRCQLCGKKVDVSKAVPHPKAPTTDHIVPVDPKAGGGRHERRNCQLAHFECNWRKGNRGTDQLRFFG